MTFVTRSSKYLVCHSFSIVNAFSLYMFVCVFTSALRTFSLWFKNHSIIHNYAHEIEAKQQRWMKERKNKRWKKKLATVKAVFSFLRGALLVYFCADIFSFIFEAKRKYNKINVGKAQYITISLHKLESNISQLENRTLLQSSIFVHFTKKKTLFVCLCTIPI